MVLRTVKNNVEKNKITSHVSGVLCSIYLPAFHSNWSTLVKVTPISTVPDHHIAPSVAKLHMAAPEWHLGVWQDERGDGI